MQFTKPEASEMQIQRVPWQGSSTIPYLSTGCKAFPSGGGKEQKRLGKRYLASYASYSHQLGSCPSAMH